MKTKLNPGLFTLLIAMAALLPAPFKAQCDYRIENRLLCFVDVSIEIFDRHPTPPPLCNIMPCHAYPDFIPGGGFVSIHCGSCPDLCNLRVSVASVAGVAVVPGSADLSSNNPPGHPIHKLPADCHPGSGTAYIFYNPAAQTYIIHP